MILELVLKWPSFFSPISALSHCHMIMLRPSKIGKKRKEIRWIFELLLLLLTSCLTQKGEAKEIKGSPAPPGERVGFR